MLTATLAVLLLASGGLLLLRRPRAGAASLLAALALLWLGGTGLVASRCLRPLQDPFPRLQAPAWGERNAVVVLGAGALSPGPGIYQPALPGYARLVEGVRLYHACRASGRSCTLLFSGGDALRIGASEAAVFRAEALALGVPEGDLLLETRSLNTFRNADYTRPLLQAGRYDRVFLVTSALHMRRSLLFFSHFGMACQPAPADHLKPLPGWFPTAYNLALADLALHEHLGVLRYRLYQALGWNG